MPINLNGYRLILGSASPYRRKILVEAQYDPEIMSAQIDEKAFGDRSDRKKFPLVPLEVAKAKRDSIAKNFGDEKPRALLITADQVSIYGDELFEKPNAKEFERRVRLYSTSIIPLEFHNGFTVTNLATGKTSERSDSTKVSFRRIPEASIKKILKHSEFLTCASGVMVEHDLWFQYITLSGRLDSNIGLTLDIIEEMMQEVL